MNDIMWHPYDLHYMTPLWSALYDTLMIYIIWHPWSIKEQLLNLFQIEQIKFAMRQILDNGNQLYIILSQSTPLIYLANWPIKQINRIIWRLRWKKKWKRPIHTLIWNYYSLEIYKIKNLQYPFSWMMRYTQKRVSIQC